MFLGISHCPPQSHLFPSSFISALNTCSLNLLKNKNNPLQSSILPASPYSFIIAVLGASVSYTVDTFVQIAFLAKVPWNELLVWLKDSDFCYTINTGPSLKLLSAIPLLSRVMRSCGYGSTGPVPSRAPTGHRWGRRWSRPTQNLGGGPEWSLSGQPRPLTGHTLHTSDGWDQLSRDQQGF